MAPASLCSRTNDSYISHNAPGQRGNWVKQQRMRFRNHRLREVCSKTTPQVETRKRLRNSLMLKKGAESGKTPGRRQSSVHGWTRRAPGPSFWSCRALNSTYNCRPVLGELKTAALAGEPERITTEPQGNLFMKENFGSFQVLTEPVSLSLLL